MELLRACDVDLILDEDDTPKAVEYWRCCNKWICHGCRYSPRRIQAAKKHWAGVVKHTFGNIAAWARG